MQIYCAPQSSPMAKAALSKITRNESGRLLPSVSFSSILPDSQQKIISILREHGQTYNVIKSLKEETGIILLDAHPDLLKNVNGEGDWLRKLVNEGIVSPANVIVIGARTIQPDEAAFLREKNIRLITMKSYHDTGEQDILDAVMETASQWKHAYVSVDMDVADPAFAPGVDAAETGGMTARELIAIVQRLRSMRNARGFDVAEIRDEKDINQLTAKLAAKLVAEFI